MVEQMVQRVRERLGEQLSGEVHRQEPRIGIDALGARHDEGARQRGDRVAHSGRRNSDIPLTVSFRTSGAAGGGL